MTSRRRGGSADLPHPLRVIQRMLFHGAVLLQLAVVVLVIGMAIYHFVEGLPWPDAFVNAAMLLGGMGPVNPIHTTLGKWLTGSYAIFAGLFFITTAGVMLTPVLHHLLGRLAEDDEKS